MIKRNIPKIMIKKILKTIRWIVTSVLIIFAVMVFTKIYSNNEQLSTESVLNTGRELIRSCRPAIEPEIVADKFFQKHAESITACEKRDNESIDEAVDELNNFFDIKEENVDLFLDELFSLKSKGKMAYFFICGNERLEKYLHEIAGKHFGKPSDLKDEVSKITNALKNDFRRNHNELVLILEVGLATLPYQLNLVNQTTEEFVENFNNSFDSSLKGMLPHTVGVQLGVESITLAIDMWVGPVIAESIISFLISKGMITGGVIAVEGAVLTGATASSGLTLGTSIVVGVVIAVGIDIILNKIAKANAKEKILASLKLWREGTLSSYRDNATNGLNHFHRIRKLALKKALILEISRDV